MKWKATVIIYVLMAFFTNAYCQVYRWEDWKAARKANGIATDVESIYAASATALWPAYWLSRTCLFLVAHPPYDCEAGDA